MSQRAQDDRGLPSIPSLDPNLERRFCEALYQNDVEGLVHLARAENIPHELWGYGGTMAAMNGNIELLDVILEHHPDGLGKALVRACEVGQVCVVTHLCDRTINDHELVFALWKACVNTQERAFAALAPQCSLMVLEEAQHNVLLSTNSLHHHRMVGEAIEQKKAQLLAQQLHQEVEQNVGPSKAADKLKI